MTSNNPGWIAGWAGLLIIGSLVSLYLQRPAELPPAPEPVEYPVPAGPDIPEAMESFATHAMPEAVESAYFEAVLFQGNYAEQQQAIRELRRLATGEAIESLTLVLGDPDARVRTAALEALASLGVDEATAAIAGLATDADSRVRADATLSLAMAGGASATEYLKLALHDPDPIVRMAAINSLGDMEDDYSVSMIQQALQDPDERVRERAIEAIDEINDDAAFRVLYPPILD